MPKLKMCVYPGDVGKSFSTTPYHYTECAKVSENRFLQFPFKTFNNDMNKIKNIRFHLHFNHPNNTLNTNTRESIGTHQPRKFL